MSQQPIELKTFYGKFTLQPEGFGGRGTVYDAHGDVVFENFIVRDELAPMVNYKTGRKTLEFDDQKRTDYTPRT